MTKREAAIISAYTGYMFGEFEDMHEYVQELLGRPIFSHEFGNAEFAEDLHERSKADFIALNIAD